MSLPSLFSKLNIFEKVTPQSCFADDDKFTIFAFALSEDVTRYEDFHTYCMLRSLLYGRIMDSQYFGIILRDFPEEVHTTVLKLIYVLCGIGISRQYPELSTKFEENVEDAYDSVEVIEKYQALVLGFPPNDPVIYPFHAPHKWGICGKLMCLTCSPGKLTNIEYDQLRYAIVYHIHKVPEWQDLCNFDCYRLKKLTLRCIMNLLGREYPYYDVEAASPLGLYCESGPLL